MNNQTFAQKGIDPYPTCAECLVKDWCGRRNGKVALPKDYPLNMECSGYVLLNQAHKLSEIPREYRNANFDTFVVDRDNREHAPVIQAVMENPVEFVNSGQNIAFLHPNKGTGKTFSACAIANEFIFKTCLKPEWFDFENPVALYVKFGDWSNEIRRAHQVHNSDLYDRMYDRIDTMKRVPLLILDDIGSGRITDVIRDLTYDVIDKRKEECLSTIYTSNFVDSALRSDNFLGEVVVSRMLYNTLVVQMGGRDRRLN